MFKLKKFMQVLQFFEKKLFKYFNNISKKIKVLKLFALSVKKKSNNKNNTKRYILVLIKIKFNLFVKILFIIFKFKKILFINIEKKNSK